MNLRSILPSVQAVMRDVGVQELMPRWQKMVANKSDPKADKSSTKDADLAAEAVYMDQLAQLIPGSIVLGEESVDANPDLLLQARRGGHEWVWIVDPLDGTAQFRAGKSVFATVVALLHHGETVLGGIYQPVTGHFATAIKGEGCRYEGAERVGLWDAPDFSETPAIFAYHGPEKIYLDHMKSGHPNHQIHLHAHVDYLVFLRGDAGFIRFSEGPGKCPPWDHAAGVLMAEEMGGVVRVERSGVLMPYDPTVRHDKMVIAANEDLLQAGLRYVRQRETEVQFLGGFFEPKGPAPTGPG